MTAASHKEKRAIILAAAKHARYMDGLSQSMAADNDQRAERCKGPPERIVELRRLALNSRSRGDAFAETAERLEIGARGDLDATLAADRPAVIAVAWDLRHNWDSDMRREMLARVIGGVRGDPKPPKVRMFSAPAPRDAVNRGVCECPGHGSRAIPIKRRAS